MKYLSIVALAAGLLLSLSGGVSARDRGGAARNNVHRYWRSAPPVKPYAPYYHRHFYPYSFFRHDPRSIIVIKPYSYYGPGTIVTSEPFYCHLHHTGFVSRAGFLDHISGTHRVPLEAADSICPDGEPSCIIEGY